MTTCRCFLLFLLTLSGGAVAATARADEAKKDEKKSVSVAHIKLSGSLSETPTLADPLFGSSAENFKAKLDRILKAKKDDKVQALFLYLDGLQVGWGKLDELCRAVADVRKSGKKVFAFLEAGSTKDYLLALSCDQVCIPEAGWLMLTGVRAEVTFYKNLFDKIGVKADMLQMGDFKGAAEPFTRTSLSPENRKQLESMLDDFYEHQIVNRIVEARKAKKWTAEHVKKLIDQGPFSAKQALKHGLVDQVIYPDDLEPMFKKALDAETIKVVKDYAKAKADDLDLSNPFALFKLLAPPKPKASLKPKIAVIYAVGAIVTGKGGKGFLTGDTVGSTSMVEAIRKAEQDKTVKAIVLRVDSPGGSALASDLIWNELRKSKKPVIASMGDVAASGGYYISMAASKIYAEPGTITGSIGVIGGKITIGGLFDKIGLKTEVIARGARADILSMEKPFSPSEKATMRSLMQDVYDQFVNKALVGRKKAGKQMTREELVKLAGGRIWTGRQARENGLIDELGTLEDAIAEAKKQAKMSADATPELLILPTPRSALETLMESLTDTRSPISQMKNLPLLREVGRQVGMLEGLLMLHGEPVWLVAPYHLQIR